MALERESRIAPARRHGPVSRLLANVRIGRRIYALVWLSLAMLGGAAAIQVVGERTVRATETEADSARAVADEIKSLELMLSRMEVAEVAIARDPAASIATFEAARTEALRRAETARAAALSLADDTANLIAGIGRIAEAFSATPAARVEIGLSDADGLRGRLKTSSLEIEAELAQWPNVAATSAKMTELRRFEQAVLATASAEDGGRLRKTINELDFAIYGGPFGADTRKSLSRLLSTYSKAAMVYVQAVGHRVDAGAELANAFDST